MSDRRGMSLDQLAKSPIRPLALRALQTVNPGDIRIWHPYYPRKVRLHSYRHKGYWFYREQREGETSARYAQLVQTTDTVIEVGAHIGFQTLHFAALAPTGRVIAFEPGSNNLPYLLYNTAGVQNIEIRRQAVGAVCGQAEFFEDNLTGQNNSLLSVGRELAVENAKSSNFSGLVLERKSVQTVTLDDSLSNTPVHFIKMDIEGGEVNALMGATELLSASMPNLMVEVAAPSRQAVWQLLVTEHGYLATGVDGRTLSSADDLNGNTFFEHPRGPKRTG